MSPHFPSFLRESFRLSSSLMPPQSGRLAEEASRHQWLVLVATLVSRWQRRRHALHRRPSSMTMGSTTAHRGFFFFYACVRVSMHALGEALVGRCQGCHRKARAHRRPTSATEELFFCFIIISKQTQTQCIAYRRGTTSAAVMATSLAGEVEGREKHDTSCLSNNGTTAPEGAEGLFSMHYPVPVTSRPQ